MFHPTFYPMVTFLVVLPLAVTWIIAVITKPNRPKVVFRYWAVNMIVCWFALLLFIYAQPPMP